MIALRIALGLLAGVALAAQLLIGRPASLSAAFACGLLMFVVAAGSVAADAIPLRAVALACSAATLPAACCWRSRGSWRAADRRRGGSRWRSSRPLPWWLSCAHERPGA